MSIFFLLIEKIQYDNSIKENGYEKWVRIFAFCVISVNVTFNMSLILFQVRNHFLNTVARSALGNVCVTSYIRGERISWVVFNMYFLGVGFTLRWWWDVEYKSKYKIIEPQRLLMTRLFGMTLHRIASKRGSKTPCVMCLRSWQRILKPLRCFVYKIVIFVISILYLKQLFVYLNSSIIAVI